MFSVSATASRVHAAPAFVTKVSKVRIFDARRRVARSTRRDDAARGVVVSTSRRPAMGGAEP